jgi:ribonuclease D
MCHFGVGRPPANLFDVQIAAALIGLPYPIGYAGLVQEVLGARAHKGETLTDWRRRPLTTGQLRYAFDDVRYLLPIHDRLAARLGELDRTAWAAEEFAGFVKWATEDDPAVEKWRKLKGAGGLRPRELAVVRAVFAWREEYAARLNRPPRVLLRDDLIVEIARRPPTKAEEVHALRGVPRGEAEAIAAAVRTALALDADDHPTAFDRDNDPPHVAQLASLLAVVLADYGGKAELAPNFVASSADLKGLVRARQPGGKLPDDSPFLSGWRAAAVRPRLEAVLDGHLSVRVADPVAAAPFTVDPIPPG